MTTSSSWTGAVAEGVGPCDVCAFMNAQGMSKAASRVVRREGLRVVFMLGDTGRRVGLRSATASGRLPHTRGQAVEVGSGVGAFILKQVAREKALGEKKGNLGANLRSHSLLRRI